MPLFHLRCPSCKKEIERIVSFSSVIECSCGTTMERVIQPIAMVMFRKIPPSLRKLTFGTAPYTRDYTDSENPRKGE